MRSVTGILLMEKLYMDKIEVFFKLELYRNHHALVQSRDRNCLSLGKNIYGFGMNFLLKYTMIDFPSFRKGSANLLDSRNLFGYFYEFPY
jgi:hypothetical protein